MGYEIVRECFLITNRLIVKLAVLKDLSLLEHQRKITGWVFFLEVIITTFSHEQMARANHIDKKWLKTHFVSDTAKYNTLHMYVIFQSEHYAMLKPDESVIQHFDSN